ncbi:MAG TPA: AIPR family protein [Candidatus Sulfotelmatobacter sp.]|nr:AIPR family protein [Candidatus Sulfotelmatobacter sp.]
MNNYDEFEAPSYTQRFLDVPVARYRKMPDPYTKTHPTEAEGRYILFAAVDVREWREVVNWPNARDPQAKKNAAVYRDVRVSLLDGRSPTTESVEEDVTPGIFMYKNSGEYIFAQRTEFYKTDDYLKLRDAQLNVTDDGVKDGVVRLFFRPPSLPEFPGDGLVNGGHTQDAILEIQRKFLGKTDSSGMPENYVLMQVYVGLPPEAVSEVSRALNSSVQVPEAAIVNLEGKFAPLKYVLKGTRLDGKIDWGPGIAYIDEESGPQRGDLDSAYVLAVLRCVMPDPRPPINSYAYRKQYILEYGDDATAYLKAAGLLQDAFTLSETIRATAGAHYSGKYGALKIVEGTTIVDRKGKTRKREPHVLPFTGKVVDQILLPQAAWAMFGAFRQFVIERDGPPTLDGKVIPGTEKLETHYEWEVPFAQILEVWHSISAKLVETAQTQLHGLGYVLNALGKSRTYWPMVDEMVAGARKDRINALQAAELEALRASLAATKTTANA